MKVGIITSIDLLKPFNKDKVKTVFNSFPVRNAHSITDEE